MDLLSEEVLRQIAKSGRCYTNEAKSMAIELLAIREAAHVPNPGHFLPAAAVCP